MVRDLKPMAGPVTAAGRDRAAAQSGLTLLEILLSLLLLSLVIIGSLALVSISSGQNKLAQNRSVATSLAAERLDLLTSVAFSGAADYADYALPGETGAAGPPPTLTADYGSIPDFPEFRRVLTLEYDSPAAGLLKAKVDVFWQDPRQGAKSHSLLTLVNPVLER